MNRKLISSISALTMLFTGMSGGFVKAEEKSDLYVLSGNAFTNEDKTLYADEGITLNTLDTGAEYQWTADSDAEIRQYDGYGRARMSTLEFYGDEMTGGHIKDESQNYLTWTKWDSGVYSTAQFDLKGVYSVSEVDVWSLTKKDVNFWQMGDIQIFAGEEKDNMTMVWQGNADSLTEEEVSGGMTQKFIRTPAKFEAVNARYINVKFKKASDVTFGETTYAVGQARIAEIVIFGNQSIGENKIRINKALAKAKEYLEGKAYYTQSSAASLVSAINELEALDDSSEQVLVDVAIEDVEAAIASLTGADTHYTLSGNKWVERDKEHFYSVWDSNLDLITADNLPSYTYLSGASPENADKEDSELKKLNSGDILDASTSVWTKWDSGTPIAVKFDLGGKYAIDRVDIVQDIQRTYNSMRYAEVYLSDDGAYFTKAGESAGNNDNKIEGDHSNSSYMHDHAMTTVQFPIKRARYVLVVTSRLGNQLRLSEIAVFGYKSSLGNLDNKIAEARDFLNAKDYYTSESLQNLQNAVDAAALLTEENSNDEINQAVENIDSALKALETINTRVVLSGNKFTDGDKSDYLTFDPSVELVNASNSPSYVWAENSSVDCSVNDKNYTKLNGGNILMFAGEYVTSTKFDDAAPGIVIWDLGMTGVIDRVDVFSGHEKYKQLGGVSVSVSQDGENFTDVKTVKAAGEYTDTEQIMNMTSVTFAPVKARYVKVTCTKAEAPARMTNINEMVIFGIGADFSALEAVLGEYDESALNTLKQFATEESYNALSDAVNKGKALLNSQSGSKAEIDAAVAEINNKFASIVYSETEGILTNNIKSEFDKTLYPDIDNLDVGMTYKLVSNDSNSQMLKEDVDFKKLTRGNIEATVGSESVYGRWSGDANVSIILDAAEEVYFTGADLYEWVNRNDGRGVAEITISVSSDGENYTDIKNVASDYKIGDEGLVQNGGFVINKLGSDFIPIKGRYIKITSAKRGNQQIFAEVVIKGFREPHIVKYPLTFGQIEYIIMDVDSGDLQDVGGADFIFASGNLINESNENAVCDVITAVYDNNNSLVAVSVCENVAIAAGTHQSWDNTLENLGGLPNGSKIKCFAWSADELMTPLAELMTK